MEPKYIFAIVVLCVFLVFFIIFFIMLSRRRRMEVRLQEWLHEVYSDKNLIKVDYDVAEEEVESQPVNTSAQDETQNTEENEEPKEKIQEDYIHDDGFYDTVDIDKIDEITGNYNP